MKPIRYLLTHLTTSTPDNMRAVQFLEGEAAGAWPWLQFHNAPREGESQYLGATLAALALGMAPPDYREKPAARTAIKQLTRYLKAARSSQTRMDQMHLVWASTLLPGLLTGPEKKAILDEVLSKQQPAGGFSLSQLVGAWKRKDNTPLDARSDGYATGLIAMVLQQPGIPRLSEPLTSSPPAWGAWRWPPPNKQVAPSLFIPVQFAMREGGIRREAGR